MGSNVFAALVLIVLGLFFLARNLGWIDSGLGSLLELTRGGAQPIPLPSGEARTFLQDGDELSIAGHARAEGYVAIGFGPCTGTVAG